ncbi:hypothetical protein Cfla_3410 [Cellulomonas flavigena DSM 20109]|uniref:Uncharacterized protein n=1 Tax=Cellulomonas flavigena (strain ATCC 482 / DSM 20109 / BCRC 11376 / JCM 18109 / NBRC 3775 / NCIMB 8073 / NRS 134) TaxID=446466 RepID=D5UCQ2_CELFN|nr:hypothetical protein [Cellulomonas flavigena]ADG76287.1 hypothetical protein Cfla_3410 [Cellulomonas flavigena DSM 20109]
MSTSVISAALADVRAQVWAAQVAVVRAGGATWAGRAADAAEGRRADLLGDLRRCLDALDAVDRLVVDARRAEQQCVAGRPLTPVAGFVPAAGLAPAVTPWG